MSARRKPLASWPPFWYLALFVCLIAASALQRSPAPIFLTSVVVTGVFALVLLVALIVPGRRASSPLDADGTLRTLAGVQTAAARPSGAPPTPVAESARHQGSIAVALALGQNSTSAVLVPRATRWLGRRYLVAVQLIAGDRVFLAGFLGEAAQARWDDRLRELATVGTYLSVPAVIVGAVRPFTVSLDFGDAEDTIARIGNEQSASS